MSANNDQPCSFLSKDKGEYKYIKDINHNNYPGPGFVKTKTGWSNREEKTSVGKSVDNGKNLSNDAKEKPFIKSLDSISDDSLFVEGLAEGIYFKVYFSLAVESTDEIVTDNVKKVINRTLLNNNIDSTKIDKEGYKKILKDLYSEFKLVKVYWCSNLT